MDMFIASALLAAILIAYNYHSLFYYNSFPGKLIPVY